MDKDLSTAIAEQLRAADTASPLRIAGAPAPVLHWTEFLAERLHTQHKLEKGDKRMVAE